jgi:hypothetical protein
VNLVISLCSSGEERLPIVKFNALARMRRLSAAIRDLNLIG